LNEIADNARFWRPLLTDDAPSDDTQILMERDYASPLMCQKPLFFGLFARLRGFPGMAPSESQCKKADLPGFWPFATQSRSAGVARKPNTANAAACARPRSPRFVL